jgi:hypothetical protein
MPQKTKRVRFLQGVLCALLATIAALHEQACPVQLMTMASFSKALFCAWALRHKHSDPSRAGTTSNPLCMRPSAPPTLGDVLRLHRQKIYALRTASPAP